jgi:hypothetical protein
MGAMLALCLQMQVRPLFWSVSTSTLLPAAPTRAEMQLSRLWADLNRCFAVLQYTIEPRYMNAIATLKLTSRNHYDLTRQSLLENCLC